MTNPMNYNQQLLNYLQAWRQLLEASAALTAGMPMGPSPMGMMPPMPPMPSMLPMPFMPPMTPPGTTAPGASPPADYSQQLFSYLQAWRQYLEHATSNASASFQPFQPTGAESAGYPSSTSGPTDSPSTGSQPTDNTGSQASGTQSSGSESPSSGHQNENRVVLRPRDPYGTIREVNVSGLREQLSRSELAGPAQGPGMRSAFAKKLTAEATPTPAQGASLYGRAASTPSSAAPTTVTGAGMDPRRAAPPATSRWWLAGQGERPGIKEQRDPTRLVNIRPTDLGGRQ